MPKTSKNKTEPASSAAAFKDKTKEQQYVRVWFVGVDGNPIGTFDDLDVAMSALRGYLATNGGKEGQLVSEVIKLEEYLSISEAEDSNYV